MRRAAVREARHREGRESLEGAGPEHSGPRSAHLELPLGLLLLCCQLLQRVLQRPGLAGVELPLLLQGPRALLVLLHPARQERSLLNAHPPKAATPPRDLAGETLSFQNFLGAVTQVRRGAVRSVRELWP